MNWFLLENEDQSFKNLVDDVYNDLVEGRIAFPDIMNTNEEEDPLAKKNVEACEKINTVIDRNDDVVNGSETNSGDADTKEFRQNCEGVGGDQINNASIQLNQDIDYLTSASSSFHSSHSPPPPPPPPPQSSLERKIIRQCCKAMKAWLLSREPRSRLPRRAQQLFPQFACVISRSLLMGASRSGRPQIARGNLTPEQRRYHRDNNAKILKCKKFIASFAVKYNEGHAAAMQIKDFEYPDVIDRLKSLHFVIMDE